MPQHPLFIKYTRDWLHDITGYSKGYLCRVARGKIPLSRAFVERVCFKLDQPEAALFLPGLGLFFTDPVQHQSDTGNRTGKPQG